MQTLDKQSLRQEMLRARRRAHAQDDPSVAAQLCAQLLTLPLPDACVFSAYWPMRGEIDPRVAMHSLHTAGHVLCLPVVTMHRGPLLFRQWTPETALVAGPFRTQQPPLQAPVVQPQILLVPLVAFDRQGNRLGYGAGHYDRTIAQLQADATIWTIGVAHADQEVPALPTEATDQPLHWIVTPQEIIACRTPPALKPCVLRD